MLDKSGSMADVVGTTTKWTAVTDGLTAYLGQSTLAGVSLGMQYFAVSNPACQGAPTICTSDAQCGNCGPCVDDGTATGTKVCVAQTSGDSCLASDYATPAVEIGPAASVASAINASVASHQPDSNTPTSAALQGAIQHAKSWAQAHGNRTVVVLATDGDPTECDIDLTNIDAIAATGLSGTPSIKTYVIGVGTSLTNLNGIAAAGGTTQAFLVNTSGDVSSQVTAALNAISAGAAPGGGCVYALPAGATSGKVNVQYKPSGGAAQPMINVASKAQCPASGDAWYYDYPAGPTTILLCDSTCTKVKADPTGEVDMLTGCTTSK
jgi:hypothetical protein